MQTIVRLLLMGIIAITTAACLLIEKRLGDAGASADVWLDADADGIKDPEDTPIEGICVWATLDPATYDEIEVSNFCRFSDPNHESHTDSNGHAGLIMFFPGASCLDVYIFVVLSEGYDLSTPGMVNGCHASFGLIPKNP